MASIWDFFGEKAGQREKPMGISDVPFYGRPAFATDNDTIIGMDELSNPVYLTPSGRKYTVSINPNPTKDIYETINTTSGNILGGVPAVADWLVNTPRDEKRDTIGKGATALGQGIIDYANMLGRGEGTMEDAFGMAFGVGAPGFARRGVYDPNITRMFLGPSAADADLDALKKARELSARRRSPDEIWNETGWFKGADDKWRFEIDDTGLGFKSDGLSKFKKDPVGRYTLVDDMAQHGALFAAYPGLRNNGHSIQKGDGWGEGSWNGADFSLASRPREDMRGILGHEFQHYVQDKEGFAGGGDPSTFADITPPDLIPARDAMRAEFMSMPGGSPERIAKIDEYYSLFDKFTPEGQYRRLAGETEARNVTKRLGMTPAERAQTPPWLTQDYPNAEQIVRFDTTSARSIPGIKYLDAGSRGAGEATPEKLSVAEQRRQANIQRFGYDPNEPPSAAPAPQVGPGLLSDYGGQHRAPTRDGGAPAFNLAGDIYPDDIYSSKAVQYYGTGSDTMDKETMRLLQSLRGNPDADVTIYRAVPKGVDDLNSGDWVTVNKQYARDHGESALGGDFEIIEKKVKAKDIFTNGDSIHEFGYDPAAPSPAGLLSIGAQ
tara:strand:+ start:2104 stop:3924 length:1821 start_codon:yes stop_codon:yes gene_type:complete